jgi:hypothetical protein
VGFLVAQNLAQRRRLIDLAHAPLAELRPEIEAALAAMGSS